MEKNVKCKVCTGPLERASLAENTPESFCTKGTCSRALILERRIESHEKSDVLAAESALKGLRNEVLVRARRNSSTVTAAGTRPATFCDANVLSTALGDDVAMLVFHEASRLLSSDAAIEEGVAIGSDVVAGGTQLGVVVVCDEGIWRNDRAMVAGSAKHTAGSVGGTNNGISRGKACVNKLITNTDRINVLPIILALVDNGMNLGIKVADSRSTREQLETGGFASLNHVANLTEIGAV
jgi:hypothetical protein